MKGYKRKHHTFDSRGRCVTRLSDVSGSRVYVSGVTVGEVKRLVGRLAKKVRRSADGGVEVIFTQNGINRPSLYWMLPKGK
jgi:hypothetical protein